jgi:quinohemoprotein ethanol dehydrogenase
VLTKLLPTLMILVVLVGCDQPGELLATPTVVGTGRPASAPAFANVDGARIIAEADSGENWLSYNRTYDEQRHSPLTHINRDNVGELGLAWFADFSSNRRQQSTPIVVDGVIYVTEAWSKVHAYNATTGERLWSFDPTVPRQWAVNACCDVVNRGVAVWEGKVFIGTIDNRLISLDASTGELIWETQTTPSGERYAITGAPRVAKDKVFIGNGGAEFGVRGFVAAYNVNSGEREWIWYTVPGNPALGFENEQMAMAAKTWGGEWWLTGGGGTVWDSIVYDPVSDLLLIGTGNGSPWPAEIRSPGGGDNLFLSSIVALDPDTGDYVWHYQTTPAESWDYTAAQHIMIADLNIKGVSRRVAMQQPKNGFFYVLDVRTGELLSAEMVIPVTWASGVDLETGRPLVNPAARYDKTGKGMVVTPYYGGSHNWHPMSFNPETGLVYIPITNRNYGYVATGKDDNHLGQNLSISTVEGPTLFEKLGIPEVNENYLLAWDPVNQKEAWRAPFNDRVGATLSTASGLVFAGNRGDYTFNAFDAKSGQLLWSKPVQTGALAGPVTFMAGGEQYVAVVGGFRTTKNYYEPNYSRLLVFKLDGAAQLPPEKQFIPLGLNPPEAFGTDEMLATGEKEFATYCSACHGMDGEARGDFPDLRYSPALNSQELFESIVIVGVRSKNGMVSFSEVITREEAGAIRAWLTKRARELQSH